MTVDPSAADTSALPYLVATGDPIDGEIRARPEDFVVEEVPAYLPIGEGDHLYVRFEKVGLDTTEAVKRIAHAMGANPREAGYAGMKDRHAITTQWASFLFGDAEKLDGATIEGVRILERARHGNKLRTGHLAGNRFTLRVRGAPSDALELARERLEELARRGVPAFFGAQRFGHGGGNLTRAARWILEGGHAPRKGFERKLGVSTLQSALFNELLAERVRESTMDDALPGDLMRKEGSGGLFVTEDATADRERVRAFEITPTGPMFGARMRWPEEEARAREEACRSRWGLDDERLERFRGAGEGTRRPYRMAITEASAEADEEGLVFRFVLPSGGYATMVLREVLGRTVA